MHVWLEKQSNRRWTWTIIRMAYSDSFAWLSWASRTSNTCQSFNCPKNTDKHTINISMNTTISKLVLSHWQRVWCAKKDVIVTFAFPNNYYLHWLELDHEMSKIIRIDTTNNQQHVFGLSLPQGLANIQNNPKSYLIRSQYARIRTRNFFRRILLFFLGFYNSPVRNVTVEFQPTFLWNVGLFIYFDHRYANMMLYFWV